MDNATAHSAENYDREIQASIPFHACFEQAICEVVSILNPNPGQWLDSGCGTGGIVSRARHIFPDTVFTLADPSETMLRQAQEKNSSQQAVSYVLADSQSLTLPDGFFDVVTAIQCHHYLEPAARELAVSNCCRMLKQGGMFLTFENFRPATKTGEKAGLERWKNYQIKAGKTEREAALHIQRFDKGYFPITLRQHFQLYEKVGFQTIELFWLTHMQAGFYMFT